MDNSTTTWIMVALLLLLIGAAIFMLLRRPGGDDTAVDSRDDASLGSRDVVAEGRDLGPGTTAPDIDAHRDEPGDRRDARDQPFDQDAVSDERSTYDEGAGAHAASDDRTVRDGAPTVDDDEGRRHEAEAVTAVGAAGAGVGDAASERGHRSDETDDVVREDDHEPTPAGGDQDTMRDAAAVGAMGAAGAGAATDEHEHTQHADADGDVHALTSEEIDAGARQEPLPTDEQTPAEGYDAGADDQGADDSGASDAGADDSGASDAGATAATTAGPDRSVPEARDEYPLEDEGTTYRGDAGDAVVVEDVAGEPGMQEEHGYHDDTTPVRGDDGPTYATGTTYPADTTAAAGERVAADQEPADAGTLDAGTQGAGAAAAGAAGVSGAAYADSTYAGSDTDRSYDDTTQADAGASTEDTYRDAGTSTAADTQGSPGETAHADAGTQEPYGDSTDEGAAGGAVFSESVYGPGSADPLEDGSGPEGWAVKGNSGSMLFHTPESPSYDAVRAEVWFESEDAARAAGFAHWDRRRR